jgi:hypothetical protein
MKTVREIIKDYLLVDKADGLCNPELECGCNIDDLVPCASDPCDCQPAVFNGDIYEVEQ